MKQMSRAWHNHFFKIFTTFACLVLPSLCFAEDLSMPSITDKSMQYLGLIFGNEFGPINLPGSHNEIISRLVEKLNYIAMSLATMVITYTSVVSTINSAQEGEAMGRKWSSIWIPMRSVSGILLMVPTPLSGYSVSQVIVMTIIIKGVALANNLWTYSLGLIRQGHTPRAIHTKFEDLENEKSARSQVENAAKNVLHSLVIMHTINNEHTNFTHRHGPMKIEFTEVASGTVGERLGRFMFGYREPETNKFIPVCGEYEISAESSNHDLQQKIFDTKRYTFRSLVRDLDPLAKKIALLGKDSNNNSISYPKQKEKLYRLSGDFLYLASVNYINQMNDLRRLKNFDSATVMGRQALLVDDAISQASTDGWIHAGSYYLLLATQLSHDDYEYVTTQQHVFEPPTIKSLSSAQENLDEGQEHIAASYTNFSNELREVLGYSGNHYKHMNERLSLVGEYISRHQDRRPLHRLGNDDGLRDLGKKIRGSKLENFLHDILEKADKITNLDQVKEKVTQAVKELEELVGEFVSSFQLDKIDKQILQPDTDPLLSMSQFGTQLMSCAEGAWMGLLATAQEETPRFFFTIVGSLTMLLWGTGAMMSLYFMMIPFMIFTAAVLGWLALVIEAVIAAPILALGFASPSQDELGKTQQGIMLLVHIFLKPVLIVIGFLFSVNLLQAAISIINYGFFGAIELSMFNSLILGWLLPLILYMGLVFAVTNKTFALIYLIPDRVLRWIGGAEDRTDTMEILNKAESTFQRGSQTTSEVYSSTTDGINSMAHQAGIESSRGNQLPQDVPRMSPTRRR